MLKAIKFSAIWCPPCKMLSPIWDQLVDDISDVEFDRVDIDDNPDEASKYNVSAVPTIVFIKDEQVVGQIVGLRSYDDLKAEIEKHK